MKDKIEHISVRHGDINNPTCMTVPKVVADRMNLKQGQFLSDKKAWEVLGESVSHGSLIIDHLIKQKDNTSQS